MSDSFPGDLKFGKNFASLNRRQGIKQILKVDRLGEETHVSVTHQEISTAWVSAHEAKLHSLGAGMVSLSLIGRSVGRLRKGLVMVDWPITGAYCSLPTHPHIEVGQFRNRFSKNQSVARAVSHVTV